MFFIYRYRYLFCTVIDYIGRNPQVLMEEKTIPHELCNLFIYILQRNALLNWEVLFSPLVRHSLTVLQLDDYTLFMNGPNMSSRLGSTVGGCLQLTKLSLRGQDLVDDIVLKNVPIYHYVMP